MTQILLLPFLLLLAEPENAAGEAPVSSAQPVTPPPVETQAPADSCGPLDDDEDLGGRAGNIVGGVTGGTCGCCVCGLGLMTPLACTLLSVLWDQNEFSGHGARLAGPAFGRVTAPVLEIMGFRLVGAFAMMALTALPSALLVALGTGGMGQGSRSTTSGVKTLGRRAGAAGEDGDSQTWVVEERALPAFRRLRVEGGGLAVRVRHGAEAAARLRGSPASLRCTGLDVRDGLLVVSLHGFHHGRKVEVEVSTPLLEGVELAGLGSVTLEEASGERLSVQVSGAGKVEAAVEVQNLTVSITGAGAVEVRGRAQALEASITGTGALRAGGLATQDARVLVSGAGSATVAPVETLDVTISGVGKVRYRGQPATIHKDVGGWGKVEPE